MKKKVLFALIALLSFVSAWAQPTLKTDYVVLQSGVAAFPEGFVVNGSEPLAYEIYDKDRETKLTSVTKVGNYFAKTKVGDNTYYLPFQVWQEASFDYVYDAATFMASVQKTGTSVGALQAYYEDCIAKAAASADGPGTNTFQGGTVANWQSERDSWNWAASTNYEPGEFYCGGAEKYKNGTGFPWIAFVAPTVGSRVRFVYTGTVGEGDTYTAHKGVYNAFGANDPVFGPADGQKKWCVASTNEEYGTGQVGVTKGGTVDNPTYTTVGVTGDGAQFFETNKFKLYWIPALTADEELNFDKANYTWTLDPTSADYTGAPIDVASYITVTAETVGENGLVSSQRVETGWTAEFYKGGTEVNEVKNAGAYQVKVFLPIQQAGTASPNPATVTKKYISSDTDQKTFTVKGKKIVITPSYVYKYFGDPDPEKPNFEYGNGEPIPDDIKAEIMQFVFFKRTAGQTGENASMYQYYIDVARADPNNNLDVTVINNFSYLIIDPLPLTVVWNADAKKSKIYGEEDPDFGYTLYNSRNEIITNWPTTLKASDYTGEALETFNAEKAAWEYVYPKITVTRDKADLRTQEGENVGNYKFIVTLDDALKSPYKDGAGKDLWNYQVTNANDLGYFTINPYSFATTIAKKNAQGKFVNPAGEVVDYEIDAEQLPDPNLVIDINDQIYTGDYQYPSPFVVDGKPAQVTVKFNHAVLGWQTLQAGADKDYNVNAAQRTETTPGYDNNKDVTRDADNTLAATAECDVIAVEGATKNFTNKRTGYFKIKPAEITISFANNFTKVYGKSDPSFAAELKYDGLKGEETIATLEGFTAPTIERVKGEDVGEYAVKINSNAAAKNYVFKTVAGKLTITPATLHVTASVTGGKQFGQTPTIVARVDQDDYQQPQDATEKDGNLLGEFEVDANGELVLDEGQPIMLDMPALCSTIVTTTNGVTTWKVTGPATVGGPEGKNYTVDYTHAMGEFNVEPATDRLKIYAEAKTKTYGTLDPPLTYYAELDGEPVDLATLYVPAKAGDGFDIKMKRTTSLTPNAAGEYDIEFLATSSVTSTAGVTTVTNPTQFGTYTATYVPAKFTITKATLYVKAKDQDVKFGAAAEPFELELFTTEAGETGLANGDTFETLLNEEIPSYTTTLIVDNNDNPITYTNKKFKEVVEYVCEYNPDEAELKDYPITTAGPELKNYQVEYHPGTLSVVVTDLTLTAKNQTIHYQNLVNNDAKSYATPAIKTEITKDNIQVTGKLPANVSLEDLVKEIKCDVTAVGTWTGAIQLVPKENANVDVTYVDGDLTVTPLNEIRLSYDNVAQVLEDHKGYEDYEGETGLSVYLPARELRADIWTAFSLPFEFRAPKLANQLYYGVIDVLDESDASENYKFTEVVNGNVAANQPFILKVAAEDATVKKGEVAMTAEQVAEVMFTNVIIPAEDADENEFVYNDDTQWPFRADAYGNKFVGQYTGKTGLAASEWAISSNPSSKNLGKFVYGGDKLKDVYFEPAVAFLQNKDNVANADLRIIIEENGTLTDINAVDAEADAEVAEGWYTITGIKLEAKPTEKGVYIYNGKKVSIQ